MLVVCSLLSLRFDVRMHANPVARRNLNIILLFSRLPLLRAGSVEYKTYQDCARRCKATYDTESE
jgi:hypothetical protein